MKSLSLNQESEQEQVMEERNCYQEYYIFKFEERIISFAIIGFLLIISSRYDKKLIIMNPKKQKQLKQIRLTQNKGDNVISFIQQSLNKKLIFLIDNPGKLIILRNNGYYKQMIALKIYYQHILCFKQLDSYQIMTAHLGGYIIITDIFLRKQLNQISSFQFFIQQIEFDCINNVIIQSSNKSINFFELNGEKIIDEQNAHQFDLFRIFLTKDNNLITTTFHNLKLWKIDYVNKTLTLLKCLEGLNNLHYLKQNVEKNRFILIDKNNIKFIDQNLEIEQQHLSKNICDPIREIINISNNLLAIFCLKQNGSVWINIFKKLI